MKTQINCKTLSEIAKIGNFRFPPKYNNVGVSALETDHEQAGPGDLTFVSEKSPAAIYRCKASIILVLREFGQVIPKSEGEVVPVEHPEEVFNRLLEACN